MNWYWWVLIGLFLYGAFVSVRKANRERILREELLRQEMAEKQRRGELITKYGSEEIADKIMRKVIWRGMTADQLRDSWGEPEDTHETVYKTKSKEEWCYGEIGKNRYSNRVYLEEDEVVGWKD